MKVNITIASRILSDGEEQTTESTVSGFLRQADNSLELTYREQGGEEGLGNTLTSLRVFADRLELSRQGDYRCLLIMEPGRRHDCDYRTPFGALTVTTDTTRFDSSLTPRGGELTLSYSLSAGGDSTQNDLHLTVTPL